MRRESICVDAGSAELATVLVWLDRWRSRMEFVSDNEGCGCCVEMWRVAAPKEALAELPEQAFCFDPAWSGQD